MSAMLGRIAGERGGHEDVERLAHSLGGRQDLKSACCIGWPSPERWK
jgi:hypothetical protein